MTDFTLHGIPRSPYARAVLLALEEKGAPYKFSAMQLGANRHPDYVAIHPFNKIPTLDDGDFRLYETHAILRYIDRAADGPALVPDSARGAARMDQLMSFSGDYLTRRVTAVLSLNRCIRPALGIAADEQAVAEAIEPSRVVFAELARLMGEGSFLVGDAISLADCIIAPHLSMLGEFAEGQDLLAGQPTLSAWLARMDDRPSMRRTTFAALTAQAGRETPLPA
jgi:glutathione S-transferase